jgi:hypothetical protein
MARHTLVQILKLALESQQWAAGLLTRNPLPIEILNRAHFLTEYSKLTVCTTRLQQQPLMFFQTQPCTKRPAENLEKLNLQNLLLA